jgi:ABC-type transport system substrate-binding protein
VYFGQLPSSPFKDERVRQAYVLTWDRPLWLDAVYNVSAFQKEGLAVEGFLEGALPSDTWKGWYADPLAKDFGPNSKFFKQDLAEAKKLLTAAGFANGVQTDISFLNETLPVSWTRPNEILMNMVRDSNLFKVNINPMSSLTWYDPKNNMQNSRGQVNGAVHILDFATPDPTNSLFGRYHSQGASYNGGDSTLDSMISKAIREFDNEKRKAILIDVQKYEAGMNYFPRMGGANQLSLAWPALRNRLVYQGGSGPQHPDLDLYIDETKPPFKKS